MTLDICPTDYGSFPEDAPPLTCGCSADAVKAGNVYGANPYFYQSSPCRAALHAGAVSAGGGEIVVTPERAAFFPAVSRNGVEGNSYGEGKGFRIATAAGGKPAPAGDSAGMTLDICPTDYGSFPEDAPPLTCGCSADAVKAGNVYGANPYFYQSSLCRAALHAGAVGAGGGEIVATPDEAAFFPAVPRNGVAAGSYGEGKGFRIATAAGGKPAPAGDSAGMTLDICPTDYGSFPEDAPPLTCGCSADAMKAGNVYGANPYFYQSSPCRAALHAGAVSAGGGEIVVTPERAAFFPAVSRNGVEGNSYGEGKGFRIATAAGGKPAPAGDSAGMTLDICPTDYGSFPEDAPPLTCGCSADAMKAGNVYGANPYFYQSSLCRAALHAGAVGAGGGEIVATPDEAAFFPAVPRNGVAAGSYGEGKGFRIATAAGGKPAPAGDSAGMTLDICPTDYGSFPEDAPPLTCGCSADAVKAGNVYGANPYFYQSSLCRAALHADAVGADGGEIVVTPDKAAFFPAVPRNGVEGNSYGEGKGFRIATAAGGRPAISIMAGDSAGMTLDICPTDYGSFPEDAPPLTCGCSADAVKAGNVYGANPYFYQSSLCRAALHAGAVSAGGGEIVVTPERAAFFPAVSRNGVEGNSYGEGKGFRIATAAGGKPAPAGDSAGMTLDICPTDYGSFPEDAPPLTCGCSADAVKAGNVYGANPYFYQSSLCRAALHAGAVSAGGGEIVVTPERAAFFPAVSRNGVAAGSYGEGMGFHVTAVPGAMPATAPTVDQAGKPIQAPIAETLRETGRVQLYVNFATDQDKPLPSSEPVLQELLATLQGDEALRVELIGHTDSQGSAPYNLDLSQRRAASVYLWLVQHGVDSGRMRSDGRGLMEPIADNASDSGRALNRRVEVKAVN